MTRSELAAQLREAGHFVGAFDRVTDVDGARAYLCVSRRTLQEWRELGKGPPCVRTARWLYPLDGLIAYLESREIVRENTQPCAKPPSFGG